LEILDFRLKKQSESPKSCFPTYAQPVRLGSTPDFGREQRRGRVTESLDRILKEFVQKIFIKTGDIYLRLRYDEAVMKIICFLREYFRKKHLWAMWQSSGKSAAEAGWHLQISEGKAKRGSKAGSAEFSKAGWHPQ
jgi:hypothetical protein